jgi:hypothetical protein
MVLGMTVRRGALSVATPPASGRGDRCALIAVDGVDGPCRGSRVVLTQGLAGMGPGVRRANAEQGLIGCGPTSWERPSLRSVTPCGPGPTPSAPPSRIRLGAGGLH